MPLIDLPITELRSYRPEVAEPSDFAAFWTRTLDESRAARVAPSLDFVDTPISELEIMDLTFSGFGGDPVRAWLTRPKGAAEPLPVVVEFVGYGGGRGLPGEQLQWAASGYVHVLMDTRGQGSVWGTGGDTDDPHGTGPSAPGFMTRGISRPEDYYYRRVYTDGVRLVEELSVLDFVDANRIAVTGGSQGGGISIAVAGLMPTVRALMPDVPFLSHFRRAVDMTPRDPFQEVARYLAVHRDQVEQAFETLSYFDGVNFARRITAPALFSVALMDDVVLPSTVFAAFNHLAGDDTQIEVYEFNGHEGGEGLHWIRQAHWLADRLS